MFQIITGYYNWIFVISFVLKLVFLFVIIIIIITIIVIIIIIIIIIIGVKDYRRTIFSTDN